MAYLGYEPSKVAVTVGQGVIDASHIEDASITTADLSNDAVTANKIDDDGTGFQMGSLGLGGAVSGSEKLTVTGTSSFSGAITGNLTGNASGTAATVTGGTQASITSAANLVTVGTIGTGVWNAGAVTSSGSIKGSATGAGRILNETASATNPTLNPRNDESSTGIGGVGSSVYIISNGTTNSTYSGTTATFAGNVKLSSSASVICTDTSDGSDNKMLTIGGGGAVANTGRGAFIDLYGQDHASNAGNLDIVAGDSGRVRVMCGTNAGTTALSVASDGLRHLNFWSITTLESR